MALAGEACAEISLTDLTGRTVQLSQPATRLLVDDGRFVVALALLHRDPISKIVAWPRDIHRIGNRQFEDYRARFPQIDKLKTVASSAGNFSVEQVLAAAPDLAVFSLGAQPTDAQRQQIEAAGIKVVIIDFFVHPAVNLEKSLMLLADATGARPAAESFLALRTQRFSLIASRVAGMDRASRPRVFLEPHAGMNDDCCNSPGKGNLGDLIEFVGGRNIGADVIGRAFGKLSMEYVLSSNPDVYIATGGSHMAGTAGLLIGDAYDASTARETLARVTSRHGLANLPVMKSNHVHGLSHQLVNSPLDILTTELLAKWVHPELFEDLDPAATLRDINTRFLAVPLRGVNWIDLR